MSVVDRFRIVFDRLEEATGTHVVEGQPVAVTLDADVLENEEIAELRRITLELAEPEPTVYTTT